MNVLNSEPPSQTASEPVHGPVSALDNLWSQHRSDPGDRTAVEQLILHYRPLVRSEVNHARSRFPKFIDAEELETAGLEALFFAVESFDASYGTSFECYARRRISGAILDRIRSLDGVPRTIRRASKTIGNATAKFEQRNGRKPSFEELAAEAGVTEDELSTLERRARMSSRLSLDVLISGRPSDGPEDDCSAGDCIPSRRENEPLKKLASDEMKAMLATAIQELPDRERSILVLHYHEGIMFSEIAAAMEISESRVSQLHTRALERLKRSLTLNDSGSPNAPAERTA